MHQLILLARDAVERFILLREIIGVPESIDDEFRCRKAGVFVCLKSEGQLRGCVGTFMPAYSSVAEETIRNAIAAATEDPRFPVITASELKWLWYTVDVLSAPERVNDAKELDARKYGVIVISGSRKGLLLPDLDGVNSVEEQLSIARMKANILPDEDASLFRFRVDRFK